MTAELAEVWCRLCAHDATRDDALCDRCRAGIEHRAAYASRILASEPHPALQIDTDEWRWFALDDGQDLADGRTLRTYFTWTGRRFEGYVATARRVTRCEVCNLPDGTGHDEAIHSALWTMWPGSVLRALGWLA